MAACVLDSSAVLALVYGEPGAELVAPYRGRGALGAVNLSECAGSMMAKGAPADETWTTLAALELEWLDFDAAQARLAAEFLPQTRAYGLSLGDRACLALGRLRRLPVLTAERGWAKLRLGVEVVLIR